MTQDNTETGYETAISDGETSIESKRVVVRAEHKDTIRVESLGECEVVKRAETYHGPRLRIEPEDESEQYLLTAPGPTFELHLWVQDEDGWTLRSEVSAEIVDMGQPEVCEFCGETVTTIHHRRRRAIGACQT